MHDEREKGSWIDSLLVEQACAKRSLIHSGKNGETRRRRHISSSSAFFFLVAVII